MDLVSLLSEHKLVLIPALPLAAAILTATCGPRLLKGNSHYPVIAALVFSFLLSLWLIADVTSANRRAANGSIDGLSPVMRVPEQVVKLWTWCGIRDAYDQEIVPPGESPLSVADGGRRDLRIDIVLRADGLTAIMLAMVTFVSTLVAIFSVGYMAGDRGYWRFFSYIALFVFSMTMLVSVSNFLLLYVFWEAVGVCSYLLIGFWYQKPEAAAAGKKAFLVNRVGDFGFALALLLIWTSYGTLNFHDALRDGNPDPQLVNAAWQAEREGRASAGESTGVVRGVLGKLRIAADDYAPTGRGDETDRRILLAICLLLLLGACGKSAQFPLHVWLPDAMEGPTPVSALIHAATMVTAGVYMITRCTPLFIQSPDAQLVVAVVGGFTALLAGLIAVTQFDLKRVLAYSTISQLGYMFLALGTGTLAGVTAGMFHLFTHAFFKAVLFLGAGSVMHAMGNVIDIRRFAGLRQRMPYTHATFAVGCLALAGIVPFSGFWSKDAILAAVHAEAEEHAAVEAGAGTAAGNAESPSHAVTGSAHSVMGLTPVMRARVYQVLYWTAIFTAFLTALYTFRVFFATFYGEERIPREAGSHAHESPPEMVWPLIILAACAAFVGVYYERTQSFAGLLAATPSLAGGSVLATKVPHAVHLDVAVLSTLAALGGLGLATYLYLGERREVDWLKWLLDLQWLSRVMDVESVARLKNLGWVRSIRQASRAVGLEWLSVLVGNLVLLVVLILSAPLLLGLYFTPYKLSLNKFYFDQIYLFVVVRPLKMLADLCYAVDRWVIDGLVDFFGRVPPALGALMRSLQTGMVQFYALVMVLGILFLITARLLWALG